ncbi:MBG domain-containing protein [Mucilaginibacter sp. FT3.2]|uniref:MBG domain-containing protein n=1 Tax=Mucilaginibacter sp. FT3.2 TaxID=2723090 RepID=UPI0016124D73|nr:MBG domain-containing protein [Mucilaginibacter sp. FT3.2]MBB6233946.1 streptogramin lyase [Mucilaginibacter sp. FT3.2]
MRKLYLSVLCALLFLLFSKNSYAQVPAFTYTTPQKLTVGTKITPVPPKHTGGAVPAQIYSKVSTLAGSGFYGYKDTVAKLARFENPVSVAFDSKGNMYVADANLNMIRKVSANGVVSTFAGNPKKGAKNGQDTAARFNYPTGVTVDKSDNVYVADFSNNMIRKITPGGLVSTFAGNVNDGRKDGNGTTANFNHPYSLTFDPTSGNIIVADTYNNMIRRITPGGDVTTIGGTGAPGRTNGFTTNATFKIPYSVAIGKNGVIYVADQGNSCIRTLYAPSSGPGFVSTFSDTTYISPYGIAVDNLNRVYLSTVDAFGIIQFDSNGKQVGLVPFSGGSYKTFNDATDTLSSYRGSMGLTFDGHDNLLIADQGNDRIRKVAVNGYTVSPRLPAGLSIDSTGTIVGTPTAIAAAKDYTITGYNSSGFAGTKVNISVGIGSQTITFNKVPAVTYGNVDFDPLATSTDTTIAITYSSNNLAIATVVNNKIHITGAGSTVITANQAANVNYTAALPVSQPLTVNKATLTVTAEDKIKTALKDNPLLTVKYKGFAYADDTTVLVSKPVITTTATANSAAGNYPIVAKGADAKNYTFNYVAGNLTVAPVPVITTTGATSIINGGSVTLSVSPATGYTYQWSVDGNAINGATSSTYVATKTGGYTVAITANNYTTYSLYTSVLSQLQLPPNNFSLMVTSATCKASNNGSIHVSALQKLKYTAVLSGNNLNQSYPFTDSLTIGSLSPGNYNICFSVDGEIFNQCYQVKITEPKDLSVYSTIDPKLNNLNLQLDGGNSFKIVLNSVTYNTSQKEISLPLATGYNKLSITTDNLCQGMVEKIIVVADKIIPFPNPFQNVLNVNIGNLNVNNVSVNIVNTLNGKRVYNNQYTNQSGVMQFDMSGLPNGVYYLNLNLDNNKSGYKIIKK